MEEKSVNVEEFKKDLLKLARKELELGKVWLELEEIEVELAKRYPFLHFFKADIDVEEYEKGTRKLRKLISESEKSLLELKECKTIGEVKRWIERVSE